MCIVGNLVHMISEQGGVKSCPGPTECLIPYHVTGACVITDPSFPVFYLAGCLFNLSSKFCLICTRIAVTWTCGQFDWFSLIIIFHQHQLPLHKNPAREGKLTPFLSLPAVYCFGLLGCPELFLNSLLSIPRECSPCISIHSSEPASLLAITRTI